MSKLLKVRIVEWYGGRVVGINRTGEYIAIIKPQYFKNGDLMRTRFTVVKVLETIKNGYGCGQCAYAKRIAEVYGEVIDD